jgi:hypothetical protein
MVTAAVLLFSCSDGVPQACETLSFAPEAEAELTSAHGQLDFVPQRPCAHTSAFTVTSVFVDTLPGAAPQPRVSFEVTRDAQPAFVLSQTRAPLPFSAVPQGSKRLRVAAGRGVAEGFVGPSGTGKDIMYLRWRLDDVTHELGATLGRSLTESEVRAIAAALMEQ